MVGEFQSNGDQIKNRIRIFRDALGPEVDKSFEQIGFIWDRAMQKRLREGSGTPLGFKKPPGQPTGKRTGRLSRSLFHEVVGRGRQINGKKLQFGSRIPGEYNYAIKQEEGGVITPKRKKYLTVPLPDAYTAGQVAPPARTFRGTFVLATKKKGKFGGLYIVQDTGTGGARGRGEGRVKDLKFLFLLRKSVKLDPRLGMLDTMRKTANAELQPRMIGAIERALIAGFAV